MILEELQLSVTRPKLSVAKTRPAWARVEEPLLVGVLGVAGFHTAYTYGHVAIPIAFFSILLFLFSLIRLARAVPSDRSAFNSGLAVGLGIYAPQLSFFWSIFGPPAVTLWAILAFWIGTFVWLFRRCEGESGPLITAALAPFLWTGLEYFRSELYYLRFAWLSPGFVFSSHPDIPGASALGSYGIGFVLAAITAGLALMRMRGVAVSTAIMGLLLPLLIYAPFRSDRTEHNGKKLAVAGVQVEFPVELEVPRLLDAALKARPDVQLFMLSEYAFDGPIPRPVRDWCGRNQRYLIAGGKDIVDASTFYNTAFVIGPTGDVVFQQAKSVPIQFFKDGLPAKERRAWNSPWGKLGICICYDLSYSRVADDLARQGVRALLVPTMDVLDWGKHEHELHARVAPIRAAEYGIPILRVTSSGVSQMVDSRGRVSASIPFGQQESTISGELDLSQEAKLPIDRRLAPLSTTITGLTVFGVGVSAAWRRRRTVDRTEVCHAVQPKRQFAPKEGQFGHAVTLFACALKGTVARLPPVPPLWTPPLNPICANDVTRLCESGKANGVSSSAR
jgi:apolipoprotein N-acyltransferase